MTEQNDLNPYNLQPETRLTTHNLTMRVEDGDYIVGRMETGEFVALPEVGKLIIELFQKNNSIQGITDFLTQEYELDFDVESFAESLIELGFIKAIDGHVLNIGAEQKSALPWLRAHHVQWLFSTPMKILYAALLVAAGFSLATQPELIPGYNDFFWTNIGSLVILVNTTLFMTNLAVHEIAHLVAARSLGVPAYFSLGTRLYDLVVQTNVTGLWAIPRRRRYRVYLAGMAWDLIPISVAILLLAYGNLPVIINKILSSLILLIFFGVLWQFQFYMRTDIYFVVLDLLHCYSLFDDSLAYLHYLFDQIKRFLLPKQAGKVLSNPLDLFSSEDQRKIKAYTILMVLGSAISTTVFVFYGVPILVTLFVEAYHSIQQGVILGQILLVMDGLLVILIEGGFQLSFLVVFVKNRRKWLSSLWTAVKHP